MKIAIIGGGWTGLVLARKLMDAGHELTIYEKEAQLGGLATFHDYGDFYWDRYYHVILPTDRHLLGFIDSIGLSDQVHWNQTYTGYYVDKRFYSVSNTKEFLTFPPLNIIQKVRLAMTLLMGARIKDWRKMEAITVEEWLVKHSGRSTFEKFWKPLLLAKLGESYKRVSAVFIWTYIKRLFTAREGSSAKKEQMGYVSGGYKTLLDHLDQQLRARLVNIRTNTTITNIHPSTGGGLSVSSNGALSFYDKVIFTGPTSLLPQLADPTLFELKGNRDAVEYLGVICMVLVLKKPLTPFYVLNIADEKIPFTGVIGMNTLVDTAETNGHHLVYLPKYVHTSDPILKKEPARIKELFLKGVMDMYPDLTTNDIVSVHIHRAMKVQPLQTLHYSTIIPTITTRHPDFYVLNTSQFTQNTLNNNAVVGHVSSFLQQYREDFNRMDLKKKTA